MQDKRIIVIGAVNIDICASSENQLILYDSNPGCTTVTYGGVGRNIAENICRLGYNVDMITVLGDDIFTRELVAASETIGIDFSHSMIVNGALCSSYTSINNSNGELIMGISDMAIYDYMTVDFIRDQMDFINSADIVILDTNIPENVIRFVTDHCKVPMFADPVSTKKARRIIDNVGAFTLIKPNIYETEVITGITISDDTSLKEAADYLHARGVKKVFISLAEEGVFYSDETGCGSLPICTQYPTVNVSGCGDAFISAVCWSYLNGDSIREMARKGECAACICSNSHSTISSKLSPEHINKLLENY